MSKQVITLTGVLFFIIVIVAGAGLDLVGAGATTATLKVKAQELLVASAGLPKA